MLSPLRLKVADLPASPSLISQPLIDLHASISSGDYAPLVDLYLPSAIQWAEGYMHRTVISRAHEWTLRGFPCNWQEIRLPRGKTQSVEQIRYWRNGAYRTLTGASSGSPAGSDYQEDLSGDDGGVLMPPRGCDWPSVDDEVPAPVVIHFTAGWAVADVPEQIIHAIALHVTQSIGHRGDDAPDEYAARAMNACLSGWCLPRVY